MRVITTHPIQTISTVSSPSELKNELEWYSNIDGRNKVQVQHFQIFANKRGANLKVNGRWNRQTKSAYARYGTQWEKVFSAAYPNYSVTSPSGKRRSGAFWDKLKNAWVAAKDAGIVDAGIAAIAAGLPAAPPAMPEAPVSAPAAPVAPIATDLGAEDEKKGGKGWLAAPIVALVIVGGYVAYKKLAK